MLPIEMEQPTRGTRPIISRRLTELNQGKAGWSGESVTGIMMLFVVILRISSSCIENGSEPEYKNRRR
jgi:hypothetical protein